LKSELYFCLKDIKADMSKIKIVEFCDIYSPNDEIQSKVNEIDIDIGQGLNKITALQVIKIFNDTLKDVDIKNIGSTKCYVNYEMRQKSMLLKITLLILSVLILFFGGAITIMNFHADVDMPRVYQNIFRFFGGKGEPPALMGILYSVGVFLGFISILNIFSRPNRTPGILDLEISAHKNQVLVFKQNNKDNLDSEKK